MVTICYDGSFEGFLSAVFDVYEYRFNSVRIVPAHRFQQTLLGKIHHSIPNEEHAKRVTIGLKKKISTGAFNQFYSCFLSELENIEDSLLEYVQYVFSSKVSIEYDFSNAAVMKIAETAKKVHREKHRMEAFVRFHLTKDGLYYSMIEPDFNVLPLIERHFKNRYADQRWLIYDQRRKYGLYYDLTAVNPVTLNFSADMNDGNSMSEIHDDSEELYQQLWKLYFQSVNIKARKNTRLHILHMPRRYWRYLVEKGGR